jgi:Alr-MurF fusion protein
VIKLADLLAANPLARIEGQAGEERFAGFAFDSRIVRPGELFVALRTARADGHDHVGHACRGGATGVLVSTPVDVSDFGATCVVVPDAEEALLLYAEHRVRESGVRVVGIGGTVGKTSAKEAVAAALTEAVPVFRTPANYSGTLGLPVALGGLEPEHRVAVLEMASGHFGEAALMAKVAPPEIAVVTAITPVHMTTFGSIDAIASEYSDLVAALPADGLAVLNGDDPLVAAMAAHSDAPIVTCGLGESNGYRAVDVKVSREGTAFELIGPEGHAKVRMVWVGAHFVRAALAAVAVAARFDIPAEATADRLRELPPVAGRLRPLAGRSRSFVLDDTYNASPAAVRAALDALEALGGPRVAVLGDMGELGPDSEREHRAVGRRAAAVVDELVTCGKEAAWAADEARAAGMDPSRVAVTYTTDDAVKAAFPHTAEGSTVLVEGSAAGRMENVVQKLMAEPGRAADLLVRQDAAWRQMILLQPDRPTWLEIDLPAIGRNVRRLRDIAAPAALMAVLKADGYGHGAVAVAHTAINNGAAWCGVACLSEAEALRGAGIDGPILVLGYTPGWQARQAVRLEVAVALFDLETAAAFDRAAADLASCARVHVKVDTGMHRLGLAPEEVPEFLSRLKELPRLKVEGLFTHFAASDEATSAGRDTTDAQLSKFESLLDSLSAAGLRPPIVHAANSAALLSLPASRFDIVRPGIAIYGLSPSREVRADGLTPALTWKSQVAQTRTLGRGEAVGYGGIWSAERTSVVATVPVGYADGFRRGPSTWRHVLVRGRPAPVVGRVSMDQTTVDVTEIPGARQGDEVVLIGRQGEASISVEDVADWLGTSSYEVVAEILPRVPRIPSSPLREEAG